jgi:gas vesicle protein
MKLNYRSIISILVGIAVAALTTLMLLPERKNGKRNGVMEKNNKTRTSLIKDRIGNTAMHKDMPDCFI